MDRARGATAPRDQPGQRFIRLEMDNRWGDGPPPPSAPSVQPGTRQLASALHGDSLGSVPPPDRGSAKPLQRLQTCATLSHPCDCQPAFPLLHAFSFVI